MNLNKVLFLLLIGIVAFTSCKDDDDNTPPLNEGVNITLRNTLQNPNEAEGTYAALFMQADNAFDEMSTISESSVEFPTALAQPASATGLQFDVNGLYEINIDGSSINFKTIAAEDDPFWGGFAEVFGTFPAGKFDRYYFTLSENHNIESFTSSNSNVNLRIDSDRVFVVEIGGGYELTATTSFTISLN